MNAEQSWISCADQLPESHQNVLGIGKDHRGRWCQIICRWVPKHSIEISEWDEFDTADWSDDGEISYWPENWYEHVENWDELTFLAVTEITLVAWMPLPNPPEALDA